MQDLEKRYIERVQRMNAAVELKEPDRVPLYGLVDNWALSYCGTTLEEAKNDVEIEYAAYSKALTDFNFDAALSPGITYPLKFIESLGGGIYDTDKETIQVATSQSEIMDVDEYDQLIEDPMKFVLNTIIPRKHKIFQKGSLEEKFGKFANAIAINGAWGQDRGMLVERYKKEHGLMVPTVAAPFMPTDLILDFLRDFRGTMLDIKRFPDKVAAASMALVKPSITYTFLAMCPQPQDDKYLALFLHLPQFLRPKDFEKVYWPSFKAFVDFFADKGYKMIIYFEKNWEHLYEYLQELPKGCIMGLFEDDDLRKTKKALGDVMCIAGGMDNNSLYYGTKEQCLDTAKKLIDDLAPGGGYIFTTTKVLLTPQDAQPENLKAVTDFVLDYGVYNK